jgi:O-antigen ligase
VLDLGPALVAGGILVAGAAATFDRVTAIEVLGLLALCVVRLPDARTASIALALGAAIAGAIALAAAGDGDAVSRHLRHGPISSREAVWGDAATAISERPFTGRGPGAFPDLQAQRHPRHPAYAHDAALEQGVDAGLVAAAGTAAALAAMLLAGLRGMASTDPRRLAAGVVATAVAASGLYDFTWSFAPIVLIGALAALALGPTYAATRDRARSSSP